MSSLLKFTEIKEYPIYDGIEPIDRYLQKLKMYTMTINKEKYKIIIDFLNIWLSNCDIKLDKIFDFKNISEKKLPSTSINNDIMKKYAKNIIKSLNISYKYDKNIDYDTKEFIAFIKLMLKSINYNINGSARNNVIYYKIVEN